MTKWTPERMRTPNGIDDAREMIVSIEAHGHPDQVDDPPPHSHLLNLALFLLNQAESQRAELDDLKARKPPPFAYLKQELADALDHIESQRAELEAADRMHRYVDWHIRRQTQNSYSLLRKSLDEYAAARNQRATSGEDDSDE